MTSEGLVLSDGHVVPSLTPNIEKLTDHSRERLRRRSSYTDPEAFPDTASMLN